MTRILNVNKHGRAPTRSYTVCSYICNYACVTVCTILTSTAITSSSLAPSTLNTSASLIMPTSTGKLIIFIASKICVILH